MNCTKTGWIKTWDSLDERIEDHKQCGCLACEDWLQELRDDPEIQIQV